MPRRSQKASEEEIVAEESETEAAEPKRQKEPLQKLLILKMLRLTKKLSLSVAGEEEEVSAVETTRAALVDFVTV